MRVSRLRREVGRGGWLSPALAIALVAAQGASLAHFALVKHAICPLHDELIHPDSEAHASPAIHPTNAHGPALSGADQDGDAARDDHCGVVGHRREVAVSTVSSPVLPQDVRPVAAPLTFQWAPPREPRFRIAPKQSPPA